eukprot:scaffold6067_cov112-Isochrysis_galbana.AAC.18
MLPRLRTIGSFVVLVSDVRVRVVAVAGGWGSRGLGEEHITHHCARRSAAVYGMAVLDFLRTQAHRARSLEVSDKLDILFGPLSPLYAIQ